MKKTYQRPTALAVRVVTGNLMVISNIDQDGGTGHPSGEAATNRGLVQRMYGIEVE